MCIRRASRGANNAGERRTPRGRDRMAVMVCAKIAPTEPKLKASCVDSPELEYVGFWLRVWATVIDSVLVAVILTPVLRIYGGGASWVDMYTSTAPSELLVNTVLPAVAVIIFWA